MEMVYSLSNFVCLLETSLCFASFLVSLLKDLNLIKSLFLQVLPSNWNTLLTAIYCFWLNFSVGWKHCKLLFFYLQAELLGVAAGAFIEFRLDAVSIILWYVILTVVFILDAKKCHCMKVSSVFAYVKCVQLSKSRWIKLDSWIHNLCSPKHLSVLPTRRFVGALLLLSAQIFNSVLVFSVDFSWTCWIWQTFSGQICSTCLWSLRGDSSAKSIVVQGPCVVNRRKLLSLYGN